MVLAQSKVLNLSLHLQSLRFKSKSPWIILDFHNIWRR